MTLKDWLKKEKMSVTEFAAAIGCSKSYVYNVSSNRGNFGYDFCRAIEEFTKGEVTREDLRPLRKVKCPTCGRINAC